MKVKIDPAPLLALLPRATLAFRSLPLAERRRIVRASISPREAAAVYRRMGAERWTSLGLPGSPMDYDLARIEREIEPPPLRRRAVACRLVGLCIVASNTFEILSGGFDKTGRRLVRVQTGTNSGVAARDETSEQARMLHVWLRSPAEGLIDLTEEQIDEFLPGVRHADGRVVTRPTRLALQGAHRLPPPLDQYRVSDQYLPVLDRALVALGLSRGPPPSLAPR